MVEPSDLLSTLPGISVWSRTVHTSVAGKQVGFEFAETRSPALQLRVGNADKAGSSAGAAPVGEGKDVRLTAEMSHVEFHAPAQRHAPVQRPLHQDHFVVSARRAKDLRVTVLAHLHILYVQT